MTITKIEVTTKEALLDLMFDDSVYVIKGYDYSNYCYMTRLNKASLEDVDKILSGRYAVIRIEK